MNQERARVLIVDDDEEIRNILGELLGRSHRCVALDAADKALALLTTQPFDLILSDISMARMSGLEMLPQVSALAPDAVVIMISAQRTIEFAIEAMRAGAFDYITKPFDLSEVNAVVSRALEHRSRKLSHLDLNGSNARAKELRDAVERAEFVVHYQPQVAIASRRIVGAEALVRWQHPQFGLLLPSDFVPLAEKTGSIVPMGASVLRAACTQARAWQKLGVAGFRIAVNVSPRQLREQVFVDRVTEVLNEIGLPPDCLEMEVTETSLMQDSESGIQTLKQLRDMGVRIAIDDFGTGYSSLGYLKRLPIDSVKLDASFVKNATTEPDDAALVMAVVTLAHTLGKKVIAEGIEREDQLAFLRLLRCDEGQGYLFGKPAVSDDMTPLLQRNNVKRLPAAA